MACCCPNQPPPSAPELAPRCNDRPVVAADHHFHASILLPARSIRIARDRKGLTVAFGVDACGVDPTAQQGVLDGIRATLRQLTVVRVRTDAVRESVDLNPPIR